MSNILYKFRHKASKKFFRGAISAPTFEKIKQTLKVTPVPMSVPGFTRGGRIWNHKKWPTFIMSQIPEEAREQFEIVLYRESKSTKKKS